MRFRESLVFWACLAVYGCDHAEDRAKTVLRGAPHNIAVNMCVDEAVKIRDNTGDPEQAGDYYMKCVQKADEAAGRK